MSRDGVRTLALHFLSLCECAVSSSLGTAQSCPRVFCCCTQFVFLSAIRIEHLLLSEVNILEHNAELSTVKTVQVQQLSMPSIQEFGRFNICSDAGQHCIVPCSVLIFIKSFNCFLFVLFVIID